MANNDERECSGDCDDVYLAADEYLNLANDQRFLLWGRPVTSETGTETGTETGKAIEPKPKRRCRRPNQLLTTRLVVTELDYGNFEPKIHVEARSCYGNQIGCMYGHAPPSMIRN